MVQVELNNMFINVGANNGSEKLLTKKKKTATSGKPGDMFRRLNWTNNIILSWPEDGRLTAETCRQV